MAFRDALDADPGLAGEYAPLKQRLAVQCEDGMDYVAGKRGFVERVLTTAGVTPARKDPYS